MWSAIGHRYRRPSFAFYILNVAESESAGERRWRRSDRRRSNQAKVKKDVKLTVCGKLLCGPADRGIERTTMTTMDAGCRLYVEFPADRCLNGQVPSGRYER